MSRHCLALDQTSCGKQFLEEQEIIQRYLDQCVTFLSGLSLQGGDSSWRQGSAVEVVLGSWKLILVQKDHVGGWQLENVTVEKQSRKRAIPLVCETEFQEQDDSYSSKKNIDPSRMYKI